MPEQNLPPGSKVGQNAVNCGGGDNNQNAGDISFSSNFIEKFIQSSDSIALKHFAETSHGGDTEIGQNANNSGGGTNNQTAGDINFSLFFFINSLVFL